MADKVIDTCRGQTDDAPCDCEEFTPSFNSPSHCEECGHGRSKHPQRTPSRSIPRTVSDIFKAYSGKPSDTGTYSDARRDALKGFKVKPDDSASSSKASTSRKSTGAKVERSENAFTVSSIVIVRSAVNKHNVMDDSCLPSRVDIAYLEQRGCALTKDVPALDRSWTYAQTTQFLMDLFPLPMQYGAVRNQKKSSAHSYWVLLSKVSRSNKLEVVPITCPDGGELYTYKGPAKSGSSSHIIYIALRCGIPDEVFQAWNPEEDSASLISESDVQGGSDDDDTSSDYAASNRMEKGKEPASGGSALATRSAMKRKLDAVNQADEQSEIVKGNQSFKRRKLVAAPHLVSALGGLDEVDIPGPWGGSYSLSLPTL